MLSIGKLGAGQERYYTEKVAEGAEDYYSGEGEAEGYWLGDAAAELGLEGSVDPEQLTAMLTGRNPATGEPLGLRQVSGRGPVPGFDLTFSIPKSASLLWALGGPEVATEIKAAHEAATRAGLDYLQRQACWTRRGAGGAEFVHGNGFLAAAYLHRSSRAGDPQVHTHVLVANATKGPDGRWTRLYHPAIYEHAKTASYVAEAHFRHEMTKRLGVRWQEVRNGIAEIEGFRDEHLRTFSTRRQQILEAAGPDASARSLQVATLATREAKEEGVSAATLRERWQAKAQEIDLTKETLAKTMGHEVIPQSGPTITQLDQAVTAHASHFDRRDVIQAVADSMQAGAPAHEVEQLADAFLVSEAVLPIGETKKGERFTTVCIWEIEHKALAEAEQMASANDRAVAGELIAARVIAQRRNLKADQRAMVKRLLEGGEGLQIVIGEAGTGKTYATLAAAEGWAAAGIELRAAAPTWRAANVLRSEGLEATSIARLLHELDREVRNANPSLADNSVLLIDEAGMVDSATIARLIDHAQMARAKLVLVGDPEQLGEIEAGGLFRAIAERQDQIVLDEVIRHRHELDREAAKRIREGRGGESLSLYRSEERVVVAPDADARREAMVADWWQSFKEGEDALMVAKRNAEVGRLNELAREVMRSQGRLGEVEIEVVGEARFSVGDQVITRINDHKAGIYNRERWQVAEVDPRDGSVVLDGIDTARRVCVDAVYLGRTTDGGDPALQHAYAATTYQAQGSTVDRAYVMADPSMDKQELYVATSRSREETWLYATPEIQTHREEFAPADLYHREGLECLAEAAERDRAQTAAHDEALRSELRRLPTEELVVRRDELAEEVRQEARTREFLTEEQKGIELAQSRHENAVAHREAVEAAPRRERKRELPRALEREAKSREELQARLTRARQLEPVTDTASRQKALAGQVLAERRELAITAARLSPPSYITKELGERPSDPAKRKAWERGVERIERYRQEHGITDPQRALGSQAEGLDRIPQRQAERTLRESQRSLGRQMEATQARDLGRSHGL
jgi:conjugative relaxase-like TrwC/TraI family protein